MILLTSAAIRIELRHPIGVQIFRFLLPLILDISQVLQRSSLYLKLASFAVEWINAWLMNTGLLPPVELDSAAAALVYFLVQLFLLYL